MTNEEEQAIEKLKGFKYFLDQSGKETIDFVLKLIENQHEKITDLSNRIMQAIDQIEDNCIAKNEDGTKREIAGVSDLEELEDILEGKE